jgi:hypothetical protein
VRPAVVMLSFSSKRKPKRDWRAAAGLAAGGGEEDGAFLPQPGLDPRLYSDAPAHTATTCDNRC